MSHGKNVFIVFTMKGCAHCTQFKKSGDLDKVKQALSEIKNLNIVEVYLNDNKQELFQAYPLFMKDYAMSAPTFFLANSSWYNQSSSNSLDIVGLGFPKNNDGITLPRSNMGQGYTRNPIKVVAWVKEELANNKIFTKPSAPVKTVGKKPVVKMSMTTKEVPRAQGKKKSWNLNTLGNSDNSSRFIFRLTDNGKVVHEGQISGSQGQKLIEHSQQINVKS